MDIAFANPMDFGMGIDALTLRPRNTDAVLATTLKEVRGSGDTQTVEFALVNAQTMEDYESTFSFSADASVTYGMFSGSGAYQFAEKHKFHSYSHYLIVSIKVTNTFKQIDKPKLNPATAGPALLANGDERRFKEQFGDSYVVGIQQGGVFFAILEFTSESQEDFESMAGNLDAGVIKTFSNHEEFSKGLSKFKA